MEVACEHDSLLSTAVQELRQDPKAASRCALWNACDLRTQPGLQLILDRIRSEKPQHVWMSPPSEAWSPLQNLNKQLPKQRQELEAKRQESLRMYVSCACIIHECVQSGIHVTLELAASSHAWRLPILVDLQKKYGLFSAVTKGCRVGWRDEDGKLQHGGWRVLSSSARLAQVLDLPCRCDKNLVQARRRTVWKPENSRYPKEFVRLATQAICQELNHCSVLEECQGKTQVPEWFGVGQVCSCEHLRHHGSGIACGVCTGEVLQGTSEGDAFQNTQVETPGEAFSAPSQPDARSRLHMSSKEKSMEQLSKQFLEQKDFSWHAVEQVLDRLGQMPAGRQRRMLQGSEGSSFVFGLHTYGTKHGITNRSHRWKDTTQYLNRALKEHLGSQASWTSFAFNKNVRTPIHRDLLNDATFHNYCIGAGNYTGGELWLETPPEYSGSDALAQDKPDGTRALGRRVPIRHKPVAFSPKAWHGTCPWEGTRYVITVYVSRSLKNQEQERVRELRNLGFQVPPCQQAHSAHMAHEGQVSGSKSSPGDEDIKRRLYLLHSATGHGSTRYLTEALRKRGASERVLQLASEFQCPVCIEKRRIGSRPLATLEPLPPKLSTVSADVGHWTHPHSREVVQFLLIVDEGSRFRAARILTRGSKQTPSAAACLEYFQEGWCQYFGQPQVLRLDPSGPFRSQAVESYCDRHQIYLDVIPGEAHHQTGVCEESVKGLKEVMTKLCLADPEVSSEEALSTGICTFNQREHIRGFSPAQHILGVNPDEVGRCLPNTTHVPPGLLVENATGEFRRAVERRSTAEKAHSEWNAAQRLLRASNSRAKPVYDYKPGDLVYFWRSQGGGQSRTQPGNKHGSFLGPARVLATETRKDQDGSLRPGSAIWCVRGRRLLKCAPEQLRHASTREEILESLADSGQATPWTYTRVAEEIGGNQYEDLRDEIPDPSEWARAQDIHEEEPPTRHRARHKRRPDADTEQLRTEPTEVPSTSGPSRPSRAGPRGHPYRATASGHWTEETHETAWVTSHSAFWDDELACVALEVPVPETNRGINAFTRDLPTYFTTALRRQAMEVSEKRLTPEERESFRQAKSVEVKNFLAAQAFEALPEGLKPSRDQAIGMRWILTWKTKEDGSVKPKARAVLLGYQDPAYEHRSTTAPVMTRQTRQLMLQLTAVRQWTIQKGDVSGAFLQGREYPDRLYCIPCDEICAAMNIPSGSITRLKRACYGLVDAPLEWYRTIAIFLEELGLERTWCDACAWVWRQEGQVKGMISGHVDDFLFAGDSKDAGWCNILRKIQERFKWGDWDTDNFTQCGVQVKRVPEGFELSQPRYLEGLAEIPVNSQRRKSLEDPTTEREKSQLRALLGGLSWYSQQVGPHVSAEVSLLLSQVTKSSVKTVLQANLLLAHARSRKEHCLKIHAFNPAENLMLYAWVDAANQNRCDGGSTQGIFIGMASEGMLQGELGAVSAISWHSSKIDRACRSPGSSEAQAAVNGEDLLYYARLQWGEILHGFPNVRAPDEVASSVKGCLVTDSRNVFDKLQTEVLSFRGAEKRTNVELLALKESQLSTQLLIRWVHSEAQLANALTKESSLAKELELFYRMDFRWKIVEDEEMKSARKRRSVGLEPLEGDAKTRG